MAGHLLPLMLLASSDAAPPYPADAVLDAFTTACVGIMDYGATVKTVRDRGWEEVPATSTPNLQKLSEVGMASVPSGGKKTGVDFRKDVKGRNLFLVLSRYEDAKAWANGCRVYDFMADAELPQSLLEKWMKRPADFRQAQEGVLTKLSWDPGWSSNVTVEAAHVPKGSALTDRTGLAGTVLVAQATGQTSP